MPRRLSTISDQAKLMQLDDAAALIGCGGRRYVAWLINNEYLRPVHFKSVRLVSRQAVEDFCREAERRGHLPDEQFHWKNDEIQSPQQPTNPQPCPTTPTPLTLISTEAPTKEPEKVSTPAKRQRRTVNTALATWTSRV